MIEIRLNGEALTLGEDTQASIEYTSGLLNEALEDAFSLPFTVPVRGNERLLGNSHQFGRRARPLKFTGAELWHDGTRLHGGVLYLEGATEDAWGEAGSISISFAADGFISELDDKPIRDLFMGKDVTVKNMLLHAKTMSTKFWPDAPYVFPMIAAPDLYSSDENPAWQPQTQEWSTSSSYAVNDLVTYKGGTGAVLRTHTYQCISSATPTDPSPPELTGKWRRTAFGIINHWDHTTQAFLSNDASGNFYALSPQFFVKEVLKRALAHYGLSPSGDWWDDERHHQLLVWNNRTLDSDSKTLYFRASQTGNASGQSPFTIPMNDDSTDPNEDLNNLWDPVAYAVTAPSTQSFHFTLHFELEFSSPVTVYVELIDPIGGMPFAGHLYNEFTTSLNETWYFTTGLVASIALQFRVTIYQGDPSATITVHGAWVSGWSAVLVTENQYALTIEPARHMPKQSLKEFILALRDIFGLRIRPMPSLSEVRFDYMTALVTAQPSRDITGDVRSRPSLDLTDPITGFKHVWDQSVPAMPDLDEMELVGPVDDEEQLSEPSRPNSYAVVLNSRRMYTTELENDTRLRWVPRSWRMDPSIIGEEDDATEVRPVLSPMRMEYVWVKGKRFLVPYTNDHGSSVFYRTGDNDASPLIAYWRGMQYNTSAATCEGGFVLLNAGTGPVNGAYCPDGSLNGHPRWTKVGGNTMEDSIYWADGFWWITSGGTSAFNPFNLRYYSPTVTDDPASMEWEVNEPGGHSSPPMYGDLSLLSATTYPFASSFDLGMTPGSTPWPTALDWTSARGPIAMHQRAMLECLIGSERVTADLEVRPSALQNHVYEEALLLKGQKCFILNLPMTYDTEPGRMISEGARILKLKNP